MSDWHNLGNDNTVYTTIYKDKGKWIIDVLKLVGSQGKNNLSLDDYLEDLGKMKFDSKAQAELEVNLWLKVQSWL